MTDHRDIVSRLAAVAASAMLAGASASGAAAQGEPSPRASDFTPVSDFVTVANPRAQKKSSEQRALSGSAAVAPTTGWLAAGMLPAGASGDFDTEKPRLRGSHSVQADDSSIRPAGDLPAEDGAPDPAEGTSSGDGRDGGIADAPESTEAGESERQTTGFDPEVFAVEVEPILDRRPARLARLEPFAPAGIRAAGFTVFPEAEVAFGATDNIFRSGGNARSDVALEVRPSVRAVSNWRVHALEIKAAGLSTFHNRFPSEDDRGGTLEARGRLDFSRRTNLEAMTSFERAQEARGSINAPGGMGDRAEYETARASLAFNHRFNRLAVQIRGSIRDTDFLPVDAGGGISISNDARDSTEKEAAARLSWTLRPSVAVFGEAAANAREYRASPSDGLRRDSTGDRLRAGVSFGSTGQTLRGEVSIGVARQHFDDSRLAAIDGVILDANLAWRVNGLTSVLFSARSDIGDSTVAGSGGALSQTIGVELRHLFRRDLAALAGVNVARLDYEGADIRELAVTSLAGLDYFINRDVTLFGRYQHVQFDSNSPGRSYNADEVRLGVRVRR